jgi:hypothetical protein
MPSRSFDAANMWVIPTEQQEPGDSASATSERTPELEPAGV